MVLWIMELKVGPPKTKSASSNGLSGGNYMLRRNQQSHTILNGQRLTEREKENWFAKNEITFDEIMYLQGILPFECAFIQPAFG